MSDPEKRGKNRAKKPKLSDQKKPGEQKREKKEKTK